MALLYILQTYTNRNLVTLYLLFDSMNLKMLNREFRAGWVGLGFMAYPYLPTPLLGQDMTQGQFLSEVLNSEFSFS